MLNCPWSHQKPKPPSIVERMAKLERIIRSRKARGNYRLKWAILDGRRLRLPVGRIAAVLGLPVEQVDRELEAMRQDAR